MRALIQRVRSASVVVSGEEVSRIEAGILLLLGIAKQDQEPDVDRLLNKALNYRVFPDTEQHMNLSLLDAGGALLIVSQFTLVADTKKGTRPSFSSAADPDTARRLYEIFVDRAGEHCPTESGVFGADMQVSLVNDGPVTFMLES